VQPTPTVSVRLQLSVDESLIRLVRLVVSGVASTIGLELDEDEKCTTLVLLGQESGTVDLQVSVECDRLVVAGQVERDPERDVDEMRAALARMIVDATAEEHEIITEPPTASFRFVTRGRAGASGGGGGAGVRPSAT
jgi:hypothetical protein